MYSGRIIKKVEHWTRSQHNQVLIPHLPHINFVNLGRSLNYHFFIWKMETTIIVLYTFRVVKIKL